jgi:DNA-binding transcriptional ArsR family regulator
MSSRKPSRKVGKALLSDDALELVAHRFRVLGEPARLKLLNRLRDGEKSVTALVGETGIGQANVSKHLALLAQAGLVGRRREGLFTYYFIADPIVFDLCNLVCARLREEFDRKAARLG